MSSGVAVIAVSFGLARYGYGLLLPDARADLGFDPTAAGLIGSGAYLSYLVANALVVPLIARTGARVPIALAMATACIGMALIATSASTAQFAVGCWLRVSQLASPFRRTPTSRRPRFPRTVAISAGPRSAPEPAGEC
ncbi:MAG: YbfB/YjiJ family MFS transporter [Geodermatophilaceae bacterium]